MGIKSKTADRYAPPELFVIKKYLEISAYNMHIIASHLYEVKI